MLGTTHGHQMTECQNEFGFEKCLEWLKKTFHYLIILEEWSEKHGNSVGEQYAMKSNVQWRNVGTSEKPEYETFTGPVNFPGHNGTIRTHDRNAPPMYEYGPFENQEAREKQMTRNIKAEMEGFDCGLYICGLAHTHSMFSKLRAVGFTVTAYSWL